MSINGGSHGTHFKPFEVALPKIRERLAAICGSVKGLNKRFALLACGPEMLTEGAVGYFCGGVGVPAGTPRPVAYSFPGEAWDGIWTSDEEKQQARE